MPGKNSALGGRIPLGGFSLLRSLFLEPADEAGFFGEVSNCSPELEKSASHRSAQGSYLPCVLRTPVALFFASNLSVENLEKSSHELPCVLGECFRTEPLRC